MAPIGRRGLAAVIPALLLAGVLVLVAAPNSPASPDTFVHVPAREDAPAADIAVSIRYPNGYVEGQKYPTIFEMSGYDGASAQGGTLSKQYVAPYYPDAPLQDDSSQVTEPWEDNSVIVHASVRGTGCSSGEFDIFSWTSALDGKYIIDDWLPQPDHTWFNGNVAIVGHSYGGITGFMVAATQPTNLRAVSVSGLIDDLYRALVYPGGVQDYGFPLLWTAGIRPLYDVAGGALPGIVRSPDQNEDPENTDPQATYHHDDGDRQQVCAENQAAKTRTTDDPVATGVSPFDADWYHARNLMTYVDRINVPIDISGAYQDEQTGPRGPARLWQAINARPGHPYARLLLTNGDHGSVNPGSSYEVAADRKAFIDHYLLTPGVTTPPFEHPVRILWEYHRDSAGHLVSNGTTDADSWPLPGNETTFEDWYFTENGALSEQAPAGAPASLPYLSGTGRQSWSYQAGPTAGSQFSTPEGQDQLVFKSRPLESARAIEGPVTATLDIATSAPDTDLFVELADEDAAGNRTYLQRGLLKASMAEIDNENTKDIDKRPDGTPFRPYRDHTLETTHPVTPGEINSYLVEIFPIGHIFRPGHRIVVLVHAPPFVDSYYMYGPERTAGINTLYVGPGYDSSINLPFVAVPANLGPELSCGKQEAVRCVPAS